MEFENKFSTPTTHATLIINLKNNEDVDCGEDYIINANGRKIYFFCRETFYSCTGWQRNKSGCKKLFVGGGKNETTYLKDHLKRCLKVKNCVDVKQQLLKATIKDSPIIHSELVANTVMSTIFYKLA